MSVGANHSLNDSPTRLCDRTVTLTNTSPLLQHPHPISPASSAPARVLDDANGSENSDSSDNDSSSPLCYICHCKSKDEPLLRDFCGCKQQSVHATCLATWLHYSAARRDGEQNPTCEVCLQRFKIPTTVATRARLRPPSVRADNNAPPLLVSVSVPAILAFIYGFSFSSFSYSFVYTAYAVTLGNLIVIAAWLLFVVGRTCQTPAMIRQKAVQDVVILLCVYVIFLCGWALQKCVLPEFSKKPVFTAAHVTNAGCMVFVSVARLLEPCCVECRRFARVQASASIR